MPIVNLGRLLADAREGGYAVPAFVSMSMEMAEAVVRAAEAESAPAIVRIHPDIRAKSAFATMGTLVRHLAAESPAPIGLSLDHGLTLADCLDAFRAGCSSVMLDAEDEPLETNARRVREVVQALAGHDVLVEAGLGHMPHGTVQTDDDKADPDDARRLVRESGCRIISPAVGNVHGTAHGETKAKADLDIDRIRALAKATGVHLCLHGGSGIPRAMMREAVAAGIDMVIIYTDVVAAFDEALRTGLGSHGSVDVLQGLVPAQAAAVAVMREKLVDTGAAGRAQAR